MTGRGPTVLTSLASAFAWTRRALPNRRWAIAEDGGSPATIDLMPARGVVAYGNRQRRHFPRHLHRWRRKGASARTTRDWCSHLSERGPTVFCHYSATMTYSIAGACGFSCDPRRLGRADGTKPHVDPPPRITAAHIILRAHDTACYRGLFASRRT